MATASGTVDVTAPAGGATASGTVTVSAAAGSATASGTVVVTAPAAYLQRFDGTSLHTVQLGRYNGTAIVWLSPNL